MRLSHQVHSQHLKRIYGFSEVYTSIHNNYVCFFLIWNLLVFFSFKPDGTEELELLATYRIVYVVFFSFQNS